MKYLPWLFVAVVLLFIVHEELWGTSAYGDPVSGVLIGVGVAFGGGLLALGLVVALCNLSGFFVQSESKRKKKRGA